MGATLGLLGNPRMRQVATAALDALGVAPTRKRVWNFAWRWWYQRTVDELLAYQIAGVTDEWAERKVAVRGTIPVEGCILVSMHQFSHHVALARAVSLVEDLGVVSMLDPQPYDYTPQPRDDFLIPRAERISRLARFYREMLGDRIFPPGIAARRGLELLRDGGSLIVLADFFGSHRDRVLGRSIPVADGPVWWAQRSDRALVPFFVALPGGANGRWQLVFGDQIPASRAALVAALETMIRQLPTTWMSWRGWYASPPHSPVAPPANV